MNNIRQQYYMNGFVLDEFKKKPKFEEMHDLLEALGRPESDEMLRESGHEFEQKYRGTWDLRPSVFSFDEVFLDVLFEQNIPEMMEQLTGERLTLAHVQVRRAGVGPSYMDWHRDTHFYHGNVVGNTPPVHKLIYYPRLGRDPEEKLQILQGSHTCIFRDEQNDQALLKYGLLPIVKYTSSDTRFIIFDTSCMHGVIPDEHPDGSVRIIYSFMRDWQYRAKYAEKDIHRELYEAYEDRLNG